MRFHSSCWHHPFSSTSSSFACLREVPIPCKATTSEWSGPQVQDSGAKRPRPWTSKTRTRFTTAFAARPVVWFLIVVIAFEYKSQVLVQRRSGLSHSPRIQIANWIETLVQQLDQQNTDSASSASSASSSASLRRALLACLCPSFEEECGSAL